MADLSVFFEIKTRIGLLHYISLDGDILSGDYDKLVKLCRGLRKAIIFIESEGNDIAEALKIASFIREKEYSTCVLPEKKCLSAAAIIWLAGNNRYMEPYSIIGFHGAYIEKNGNYKIDPISNAKIGAFLSDLKLSREALEFILGATPPDFNFLMFSDTNRLGIKVISAQGIEVPKEESEELDARLSNIFDKALEQAFEGLANGGIAGMNVAIAGAYRDCIKSRKIEDLFIAGVIDKITSDFDFTYCKMTNSPVYEKNEMAKSFRRFNKVAYKAGICGDDLEKCLQDMDKYLPFILYVFYSELKNKYDTASA